MLNWQPQHGGRFETIGSAPSQTDGTTVTSDGTNHTKGNWVDLGDPTGFDWHGFTFIATTEGGTNNADFLADIGINVGGNRYVIVENLYCSLRRGARCAPANVDIPVFVPAGSQISVRCQASVGGRQLVCVIIGRSQNLWGAPGFGRVITMGADTGTSRGVEIDPATANTDTAYVELEDSLAETVAAFWIQVGCGNQPSRDNTHCYLVDIAVGAAAAEGNILNDWFVCSDATEDTPLAGTIGPLPCQIAAGERVAARARCHDVTAGERKLDLVLYGLVP